MQMSYGTLNVGYVDQFAAHLNYTTQDRWPDEVL